jgi:hypothetical protein
VDGFRLARLLDAQAATVKRATLYTADYYDHVEHQIFGFAFLQSP